jgi:hypothetical protein
LSAHDIKLLCGGLLDYIIWINNSYVCLPDGLFNLDYIIWMDNKPKQTCPNFIIMMNNIGSGTFIFWIKLFIMEFDSGFHTKKHAISSMLANKQIVSEAYSYDLAHSCNGLPKDELELGEPTSSRNYCFVIDG